MSDRPGEIGGDAGRGGRIEAIMSGGGAPAHGCGARD